MSRIDPILLQKCKNNKQRKLANIRTRNSLNETYASMKRQGLISFWKIVGVRIKNRVQSAAIIVLPHATLDNIKVDISFNNPSE